jgi:hypothetical protein
LCALVSKRRQLSINRKIAEASSDKEHVATLNAQAEKSMAYIRDHDGPGEGGGNGENQRHHKEWTRAELKHALDEANIPFKQSMSKEVLLGLYQQLLEASHESVVESDFDDGSDHSDDNEPTHAENETTSNFIPTSVTIDNDADDADDDDDDDGDDEHIYYNQNIIAPSRSRRAVINEPKWDNHYPCSCGCEGSFAGEDMELVYVRRSCNTHWLCVSCNQN